MTHDPNREKPEWWIENEKLREFLGLPTYSPPRFADGVFTHEIVPSLEREYDCEIRFIGMNTEYLEEWDVRVDGEDAFEIGRHRDENGNTIYEIESETFRRRIEQRLEGS